MSPFFEFIEKFNWAHTGECRVALLDKDDNVRSRFSTTECSINGAPSMVYYTAFVTGTISPNKELHLGDKFILEYSENGVWKKMCAGKGEEGRIIDEYAAFDIPFIEVNPNGYSSGDKLKLRITNVSRPYDVDWYFDGGKLTLAQLTLSQGNVTLTSGIHRIKAEVKYSDGTKEILVQEIKVK